MSKKIHIFPLNRVEGDLKIHLEIENNVVSNAWSSGTMYRGFENIMTGRGSLDGLVITPRICGVCSTAHLKSAAKALDMAFNAAVPDNGKRVRNISLMAEMLQNDVRHAFLLFMCDFANIFYKDHSLYNEAVRRYEPLKGETSLHTIRETKKLLEIIAILGGQWPHSSFMVPGGVVSVPSPKDITQCRYLLKNFRKWYENRILGCNLERWLEIKTKSDIRTWLEESESHRESELGFFIRFSQETDMDKIGKGHGNFISFGSLSMPEYTNVTSISNETVFFPSGFATATEVKPFQQEKVAEEVAHSWFNGYKGGMHPFEGITTPYATGMEGEKYSWTKAPRYEGLPAETGPLAEMVIARDPLFTELVQTEGPSVFTRELARLVRPVFIMPVMDSWLKEMTSNKDDFFQDYSPSDSGEGFGLTNAPRGALGHWIKIKDTKIENYQIITPTSWNASPRDSGNVRGPIEQALIGTEIRDIENPVEAGLIVRSFDPCLVCTVHAISEK